MMNTTTIDHTDHSNPVSAKIGMWLFLFTEILLFGGLFLLYAVYRSKYTADFHYCSTLLSTPLGTLNTVILLTSSLTMVLSIAALERNQRKLSIFFVSSTIVMGLAFLVIKYFEWSAKFHHHLYPGSEELVLHTPGENVFFGLYYTMTGLHALHIIIGLIILCVMLFIVGRKPRKTLTFNGSQLNSVQVNGLETRVFEKEDQLDHLEITMVYEDNEALNEKSIIKLENSGLYWHLVDVIWIFLFPLLYLIS